MKINRHGRAKVLTQSEIQLIFSDGLENDRDGNENTAGIALCSVSAYLVFAVSANAVRYKLKISTHPRAMSDPGW